MQVSIYKTGETLSFGWTLNKKQGPSLAEIKIDLYTNFPRIGEQLNFSKYIDRGGTNFERVNYESLIDKVVWSFSDGDLMDVSIFVTVLSTSTGY